MSQWKLSKYVLCVFLQCRIRVVVLIINERAQVNIWPYLLICVYFCLLYIYSDELCLLLRWFSFYLLNGKSQNPHLFLVLSPRCVFYPSTEYITTLSISPLSVAFFFRIVSLNKQKKNLVLCYFELPGCLTSTSSHGEVEQMYSETPPNPTTFLHSMEAANAVSLLR